MSSEQSYHDQIRELRKPYRDDIYDEGYNDAVDECQSIAAEAQATIADQAAEIERLREVVEAHKKVVQRQRNKAAKNRRRAEEAEARVRELEDNDAIGRRLTDGHLARIAELEAVVGKLPRTADGVPTYPGMPAWFAFRDGVHEAVLMMQSSGLRVEAYFPDGLEIFRDDDDEPYEVDYSRPAYSACYSTREAALAAAEAKSATEQGKGQ